MKKSPIILLLLLAAFSFAACGDAIEIPEVGTPEKKDDPAPSDGVSGDVIFTATIAQLSDGSQPEWQKGAQILLSDGNTVQTLTNTAESGVLATFPGKVAAGSGNFVAITPAVSQAVFDGSTVVVDLPEARSLGVSDPDVMVAKASGTNLYFKTLLAKINYSVSVPGATKVVFKTAGGEKISGKVGIDYSGNEPVVSAQSDEITISGDFKEGETYSIYLPPVSLSGYSVVVMAGDVEKAHITGEAVDLKAGLPSELPVFTNDIPTYRIVKMQLWGGTGPEYDCTKVYDLFKKPGCFNNEDGRGIEALMDNYLVFNDDGTFINYAGEDGRNWWFVYSGEQNPADHKDVDLRSMYDLLPLAEGRFSLDGGTCTFTKADGSTTTATWLPAGTYPMPGTSPQLSVTIEKEALLFQIQGGKDNWTYSWQDYGVIACHPRALFIELEKMPAGFIVPEESCTFDDDFKYVDVDDLFDWDGLAASWNVYGGNASPYGIFVLGGSGDDPAFISPIDKSWDWDDSIWKESDNGLVIKVSEKTNSQIKGTTNWWAGNDGAFWNYTWKSSGEDLSRFYDKIPKGEKEFTLDLSTLAVTLANGETAQFLVPGEHAFAYGRTITVPDGCFAFAFHLGDPIEPTSQRWTDVDRFVNAPLEYIIIFEKQ